MSDHHRTARRSDDHREHSLKRTHSRSRSRSPTRRQRHEIGQDQKRSRRHTKPEHKHHHRHHEHHLDNKSTPINPPAQLPLNALPISKHDLSFYRPMLALYLDIQKQLDIEELSEDEVRGRWKSFVNKWNLGDLAEGWYDPATFEKARSGTFGLRGDDNDGADHHATQAKTTAEKATKLGGKVAVAKDSKPSTGRRNFHRDENREEDSEADDSDFGPRPLTMPSGKTHSRYDDSEMEEGEEEGGEEGNGNDDDNSDKYRDRNMTTATAAGPSIPSTSDLRAYHEQERDEAEAARSRAAQNVRVERAAERKLHKERLEELVPRAEPGSRERRLEKQRDVAAANRAFAAAKDGGGGGDVELRDAEVMGEEDGLGELRRMKEIDQRKKTEREVRREGLLRARIAEREERMKGLREKEAKTMEMLKSIARSRFGE